MVTFTVCTHTQKNLHYCWASWLKVIIWKHTHTQAAKSCAAPVKYIHHVMFCRIMFIKPRYLWCKNRMSTNKKQQMFGLHLRVHLCRWVSHHAVLPSSTVKINPKVSNQRRIPQEVEKLCRNIIAFLTKGFTPHVSIIIDAKHGKTIQPRQKKKSERHCLEVEAI